MHIHHILTHSPGSSMELKVWVEGIQRVICGVTQDTTCQEVVVALAHATGRTGRFTLVERWKNTERLVAPTEHPLLSLHKWGEYASDVQFILRHSKSRTDKQTDQFNQHNFTPHLPEVPKSSNIKKSLTFSGAHTHRHTRRTENSSGESVEDQSSFYSHSSKSSVSPYSSLEKKPKLSSLKTESIKNPSAYSSVSFSRTPPLMKRTTPAGSPQKAPEKSRSTNALHNLAFSSSQSPHKTNTPNMPGLSLHNSTPTLTGSRLEEYDLDKHLRPSSGLDLLKVNGDVKVNGNFHDYKEKVIEGTDKESLLQLIKEQQERLEAQESNISSFDTEIQRWEDKEKDYTEKSENIKREYTRLEVLEVQLNLELRELHVLEGHLEAELKAEKGIKSELTTARSRLSHAEKKLQEMVKKMEEVQRELELLQKEQQKEIQEAKDREISMLQEVSHLQREINNKLVEHELQSESLQKLTSEMKDLESELAQRQQQANDLEKQLKDTNLQEFLVLPADSIKEACDIQLDKRENVKQVFPIKARQCQKTDSPNLTENTEGIGCKPSRIMGINREFHASPILESNNDRSALQMLHELENASESSSDLAVQRVRSLSEGSIVDTSKRIHGSPIRTPHRMNIGEVDEASLRTDCEAADVADTMATDYVSNMVAIGVKHNKNIEKQTFVWPQDGATPQFLYYL